MSVFCSFKVDPDMNNASQLWQWGLKRKDDTFEVGGTEMKVAGVVVILIKYKKTKSIVGNNAEWLENN